MDEIVCIGDGIWDTVVAGVLPDVVGMRVARVGAVECDTSGTCNVDMEGIVVDTVGVYEIVGGAREKVGWDVFTASKAVEYVSVSHRYVRHSSLLPEVDVTAATTAS